MRELSRGGLVAAAGLSLLAGFVDAVGFLKLGGYFVSFMSGNTTRGGVEFAAGADWPIALILVGCFVAGVIAGSAVGRVARLRPIATLALMTLLLVAALLLSELAAREVIAGLMAAAMGTVNTLFSRSGEATFGVTYMTGALVKFGQGLTGWLFGERGRHWLRYGLLWLAISTGAVLGAFAYGQVGFAALGLAVAGGLAAVVVAVWAARRSARR